MQKIWQWFRDKKSNTIRKWRSSALGRNGEQDPYDDYPMDIHFTNAGTPLLGVPGSRLEPIGGSDNLLTRRKRSQRNGTISKLTRKLTPSKMKNGRTPSLKQAEADTTHEELRELLLVEDAEQRKSVDWSMDEMRDSSSRLTENSSTHAGGARPSTSSVSTREVSPSDCFDDFDEDNLDADPAALPPLPHGSTGPASGGPAWRRSLSGPAASASPTTDFRPTSVKTERRKLRFIIPQVSVSSADDPASSTTLLLGSPASSQESLEQMAALTPVEPSHEGGNSPILTSSSPETSRRRSAHSSTGNSPTPLPKRVNTEVEKRKVSLAQRRQSTIQLVQSASGRRTSTTFIPLTVAQIHLIRSLWRQVYVTKGPTVIGQTIIHRLFFKYPKLKDQFRKCALPKQFPNHDSFAKAHCKAVAELVDQVVENLDSLESMSAELERIGKIHAQVLNGQLSSKLWNSVAETFIDCTLEWGDRRCRSETVRKAWALIIAFMMEKIKTGHLEQRKQMLVMRSTIASLERVAFNYAPTTVS
jgi:hemoglobin-like flavoprotein